jgi:hypothetical protein
VTTDAAARRLLAGLVDERALETEPIAEVRADLAALGLDPARAIALARRLAAGAATPAATLLGRIEEAEESDDEIRHLEQADIASVRRNLKEGTTAATIANAQRAAGQQANVVGLRRRRPRRLWYGLGGVAAALAASVVFYVGLSANRLPQGAHDKVSGFSSTTGQTKTNEIGSVPVSMTPPAEEPYGTVVDRQVQALPAEPTDSDSASASQPAANVTDNLQARLAPAAEGPPQPAEQAAGMAATPQRSVDAETTARAKSEADENQATRLLGAESESQLADAPAQTAGSATTLSAGEAGTEEVRGDVLANQVAMPFGLTRPVAALLIVDPKLVPAGLKQEDYSMGDLLPRLDDARRLAGDRRIAALVTLRLVGRTADAAVIIGVPAETLVLRRDFEKAAEPLAYPVSAGSGYDVILLDRR